MKKLLAGLVVVSLAVTGYLVAAGKTGAKAGTCPMQAVAAESGCCGAAAATAKEGTCPMEASAANCEACPSQTACEQGATCPMKGGESESVAAKPAAVPVTE